MHKYAHYTIRFVGSVELISNAKSQTFQLIFPRSFSFPALVVKLTIST